jgi:hypothetical protein
MEQLHWVSVRGMRGSSSVTLPQWQEAVSIAAYYQALLASEPSSRVTGVAFDVAGGAVMMA